MATITVPSEYGYVLLTLTLTSANTVWHAFRIPAFRKPAGVAYPTLYAEASTIAAAPSAERKHALYVYNCAQRSHGNFLENLPLAVLGMLVGGLLYPRTAAGLGLAWNLGRVVYAVGYTDGTPDGKGRLKGAVSNIPLLGLIGLVGLVGVKLLRWA